MLFELGQIVATPGALAEFERAEEDVRPYLQRHAKGDWGEVYNEDKQENERSVRGNFRILSAYTLSTGEKIWVITEADRSVTTVLLPSEY
jgi:hypothetical protein